MAQSGFAQTGTMGQLYLGRAFSWARLCCCWASRSWWPGCLREMLEIELEMAECFSFLLFLSGIIPVWDSSPRCAALVCKYLFHWGKLKHNFNHDVQASVSLPRTNLPELIRNALYTGLGQSCFFPEGGGLAQIMLYINCSVGLGKEGECEVCLQESLF